MTATERTWAEAAAVVRASRPALPAQPVPATTTTKTTPRARKGASAG